MVGLYFYKLLKMIDIYVVVVVRVFYLFGFFL